MTPPLVSIGIPTYNRGALLDRAVASALAQTVGDLEVVISDNASADDTAERCRTWAERDPRVRVVRHPENLGPTANFNSLFTGCRGTYVLMLSDDDYLDADYVETCVRALEADPGLVAVAGTAHYVRNGVFTHEGDAINLPQDSPSARVRAYFRNGGDGPFYGVVRREIVERAAPMPNLLANDWLHVGRVAAQGRIAMTATTHVNRERDGTSATTENILQTFGLKTWRARIPHLLMAWYVFGDITRRGHVYATLGGTPRRVWVALRAAPGVINWTSLAWYMTAPTFLGLERWRATRWIARGYDRVTRALGAGRQP